MPLSCRLGHNKPPNPRAMPQALSLANNCHSLLSYTILLAWPTFKPLFFRQSFTESIHLFHHQTTKRLPTHSLTYTLLAILSFRNLSIWPNQRSTLSSILSSAPFVTPHIPLICAFATISILIIPNRPLRLSICTALILES